MRRWVDTVFPTRIPFNEKSTAIVSNQNSINTIQRISIILEIGIAALNDLFHTNV